MSAPNSLEKFKVKYELPNKKDSELAKLARNFFDRARQKFKR